MKKTAYFRNGILYDVFPRDRSVSLYEDRQTAYDTDTIILSDGDRYDPADPASVKELHVPTFDRLNEQTVFDLSYILKMRCAAVDDPAYVPAFVCKTLDMMEASPIAWRRGDYLRVICNFYCNGLFEEGDRFEAEYRATHKALFSNPLDELQEAEHLSTKYHFEDKWRRHQEYRDVKRLLPDAVPDTVKGYLQIRTRRTKRFLEIQAAAEATGYAFDLRGPYHFCRKYKEAAAISQEWDHSTRYPTLVAVQCDLRNKRGCDGHDTCGISCVFPQN